MTIYSISLVKPNRKKPMLGFFSFVILLNYFSLSLIVEISKKERRLFLLAYKTFSELVKDAGGGNGALEGSKITGDKANKMVKFYSYWSNYLEPTNVVMSFLAIIGGALAKAVYYILASLEHVFNNMFKLFGLFGYLGDQTTIIGKIYFYLQMFGFTLFVLILIFSATTGVFTKPVKYKNAILTFLVVTFVTAVLPLGLTTVTSAMAQDVQNVQTMSADGKKTKESLSIQPVKNNVTDLKILIDKDFNTELFPLDNQGFIKPVKEGSTPINNITDAKSKKNSSNYISKIDFGATYGVSNTDLLGDWNKTRTGIKGLMLHKLNSNADGIETIHTHKIVSGLNAFESVYLRYKVNWVAMFAQFFVLIVLFITMSIKLVKSVFDIIIQALISPILGYSGLRTKKYKELLLTIAGALAGIFFEVIIMRVTLEICRDLPSLSVSAVSKLSGGFFDGLNMWEQAIAATIVYLGVFLGAMQGVSMIERWLGVSTSQNDTAQQLMGAMMMGNAFAAGAGTLGAGLGHATGAAASGIAKGAKTTTGGIVKAGGGLKGLSNAVKDQGVGGTVKGGIKNLGGLATDKFNQGSDKINGLFDGARDKTYQSFTDSNAPLPGGEKFGDAATHREESGVPSGLGFTPTEGPELDTNPEPTPTQTTQQGGITDPTTKLSAGGSGPISSSSPKPSSSSKKSDGGLNHTLQNMKQHNQQMNMGSQKLFGGQDHIKGFESDDSGE